MPKTRSKTSATAPGDEWLTLRATARTLGLTIYKTLKLVAAGSIRTMAVQESVTRFHRDDVMRLAQSKLPKRPKGPTRPTKPTTKPKRMPASALAPAR